MWVYETPVIALSLVPLIVWKRVRERRPLLDVVDLIRRRGVPVVSVSTARLGYGSTSGSCCRSFLCCSCWRRGGGACCWSPLAVAGERIAAAAL
jgi:hypothetical protein